MNDSAAAERAAAERADADHAAAERADADHADAEHADADHADAEHADAEHADGDRGEVCWLERVCQECGALVDGPLPKACWRCGYTVTPT
ncbi:hypothetical protein [Lacisediminihabitans sp.]|uniref:hypothetical protein n=1 Tax=Lacisediminihabitans sp. TaxID=2787631 RepID=UPI002F91E86E